MKNLTLEETLTILFTIALVAYIGIHAAYWKSVLILISIDPFMLLNIWIETGGILPN